MPKVMKTPLLLLVVMSMIGTSYAGQSTQPVAHSLGSFSPVAIQLENAADQLKLKEATLKTLQLNQQIDELSGLGASGNSTHGVNIELKRIVGLTGHRTATVSFSGHQLNLKVGSHLGKGRIVKAIYPERIVLENTHNKQTQVIYLSAQVQKLDNGQASLASSPTGSAF